MLIELKKQLRFIDLAMAAAQKRKSQMTGFVHIGDAIPIYENVCFAMALFKQKKGDTVLEAKELILRLIEFQSKEGNFPVSLHEFPVCHDIKMGLKIAPIFIRILKQFESVLGLEFSKKVNESLEKIFHFYADKQLKPLWDFRLKILKNETYPCLDTSQFSAFDLWEYWVALQFVQIPVCDFYDPRLQLSLRFYQYQDGLEPASHLIDWCAAGTVGEFSSRLLKDHPLQIQLAALDCIDIQPFHSDQKFVWKEDVHLHSLFIGSIAKKIDDGIYVIEFDNEFCSQKEDLFEFSLFCDRSPDIQILVEGKPSTTFSFDQQITISSPSKSGLVLCHYKRRRS